jgi:hypothetical protein
MLVLMGRRVSSEHSSPPVVHVWVSARRRRDPDTNERSQRGDYPSALGYQLWLDWFADTFGTGPS